MNKYRILASTVTFNRKDMLLKCLEKINNQTYHPSEILVIDNNSSDGTDKLITKLPYKITYKKLDYNGGSSGGQYIAFEYAYKNNFDFLWTMDDDGIPDSDCLKSLLNNSFVTIRKPLILNSLIIDINDHKNLAYGIFINHKLLKLKKEINEKYIEGWASLFNSTLINNKAIKTNGFPNKKLFIWGDEQEYLFRAKQNKIPTITVTNSLFFHPSSTKNLFSSEIELKNFWKIYYLIRNSKYYQKYKYPKICLPFINFYTFLYYLYIICSRQKKDIFKKIKIIFVAYSHSLVNYLDYDLSLIKKLCT